MAFEVYIPNSRRRSAEKEVSISKIGVLGISAACREEWIPKATAAQLLFDPEKKLVAIKPVPDNSKHSLRIRQQARSRSVQISAVGFLDYNGIPHQEPQRYPAHWDDTLKAIVFDTTKPVAS